MPSDSTLLDMPSDSTLLNMPSDSTLLNMPSEIIAMIIETYIDIHGVLLCPALTCKKLRDLIVQKSLIETSYADCISSPERMKWVLSFPTDDRPSFLRGNDGINSVTAELAASAGHLSTLQFLGENDYFWRETDMVMMAAIRNGHLPVVEFLVKNNITDIYGTCPAERETWWAALAGHLDILKFLHAQGYPCEIRTTTYATQGGHLDILKFLHEKGCILDKEELTRIATQGGHLDILRFLHEKDCLVVSISTWWAEMYREHGILKFLHELEVLD